MAGMTPRTPGGHGHAARWMTMAWRGSSSPTWAGFRRREGGVSNWLMGMGQRDLFGGRLTLMAELAGRPRCTRAVRRCCSRPARHRRPAAGGPPASARLLHEPLRRLAAAGRGRRLLGPGRAARQPALGPTSSHRAWRREPHRHPLPLQDSAHHGRRGDRRRRLAVRQPRGSRPSARRWTRAAGPDPARSTLVGAREADLGGGWSGQCPTASCTSRKRSTPGVKRTTASLHYGEGGDRSLRASFVWGRNVESHGTFNGYLLEAPASSRRWTSSRAAEQVTATSTCCVQGLTPVTRVMLEEEERLVDRRTAVRALTVGYFATLPGCRPHAVGPVLGLARPDAATSVAAGRDVRRVVAVARSCAHAGAARQPPRASCYARAGSGSARRTGASELRLRPRPLAPCAPATGAAPGLAAFGASPQTPGLHAMTR
jgi:hypothetical protein